MLQDTVLLSRNFCGSEKNMSIFIVISNETKPLSKQPA